MMQMAAAVEAAERIERELGEWGSISMRLGDEYVRDMQGLTGFVREAVETLEDVRDWLRHVVPVGTPDATLKLRMVNDTLAKAKGES